MSMQIGVERRNILVSGLQKNPKRAGKNCIICDSRIPFKKSH